MGGRNKLNTVGRYGLNSCASRQGPVASLSNAHDTSHISSTVDPVLPGAVRLKVHDLITFLKYDKSIMT
jgi:hypothetical protein